MPRILLYEFASSGGLLGCRDPVADSIRREGAAMLSALAFDFAAIPNVETLVMLADDVMIRLPDCPSITVLSPGEDLQQLAELSRNVDWAVVVAPEFDDLLYSRCRLVESQGGRLLGPSSSLVVLAADKQHAAEHLAAAGVNVPLGFAISPSDPLPDAISFPAVLKPRFGAGSDRVRLIKDRTALVEHGWPGLDLREAPVKEQLSNDIGIGSKTSGAPPGLRRSLQPRPPGVKCTDRIETFCPGLAASVAFLCGPAGRFALPPCRQRLSDDGQFRYLGGELPLPPAMAARATELAARAVASLPGPLGYVGVDLVLGPGNDAIDDVVIEINARLTTSYVGLRALAKENLAAAMLGAASGGRPRLSFRSRRLEFTSAGKVRDL